jgi:hypothetical protein
LLLPLLGTPNNEDWLPAAPVISDVYGESTGLVELPGVFAVAPV